MSRDAELQRIISELRAYNPAADEYKGEHIHKVWARELEAILTRTEAAQVSDGELSAIVDEMRTCARWFAGTYAADRTTNWADRLACIQSSKTSLDRYLESGAVQEDASRPLLAARETEDDGAAIMGRLARALAKADPASKLPRMAIEWLRSQGVHWKSHCPTDPVHDFGEAAPVVDGAVAEIDPESPNFKAGMGVGMSCLHSLERLIDDPACSVCGARNAKEAETMCRPGSDDECPGSGWPLSKLWGEASHPQDASARDAERYRWLRNDPPSSLAVRADKRNGMHNVYLDGEQLDAAIDAAMSATAKESSDE